MDARGAFLPLFFSLVHLFFKNHRKTFFFHIIFFKCHIFFTSSVTPRCAMPRTLRRRCAHIFLLQTQRTPNPLTHFSDLFFGGDVDQVDDGRLKDTLRHLTWPDLCAQKKCVAGAGAGAGAGEQRSAFNTEIHFHSIQDFCETIQKWGTWTVLKSNAFLSISSDTSWKALP